MKGKQTGVKVTGGNFRGEIQRVRVMGREEQTFPEKARDAFILSALQGKLPPVMDSPFIGRLWFPPTVCIGKRQNVVEGRGNVSARPVAGSLNIRPELNQSQMAVVRAMLSEDEPIVIVHGAWLL